LVIAALALCARTEAEDLSVLAGVTDTSDHTSGTYAWGLEYRQQLLSHFDASFGYLNEGHLPNDHRDGAMVQLWADTGPWLQRWSLSLGAGPYAYFDTRNSFNFQGYRNEHGLAALLTARARFVISQQWFALLEVSQLTGVAPSTRTVMLGGGYSLDRVLAQLGEEQPLDSAVAPNELGMFAGVTTINNLQSDKSTDYGIEYRFRAMRHVDLSASVLEEGNGASFRHHAGMIGEAWLVQDFLPRGQFTAGLGVGPYVALGAYQTSDGRAGARVLGMASMTLAWRFTRSLAVRANWHRGFTGDDQDRDILSLGLALRF
jgi:hypothetical protein